MNNLVLKEQDTLTLSNLDIANITIQKASNITINLCDFNGDALKIDVLENATLKLIYFTQQDLNNQIQINVHRNSILDLDLILMNGDTNLDLAIIANGEGANINVNTLSLAKGATKNINIKIIHENKYTKSNVTNYGISFAEGINRFKTIGKINKLMTASDVRQITKGLLLSPTGICLAEPILLIDYFDVKAYHGATIGKINDDDLFYLMSRGLTKNEAFMLVINGLVTPFVDKIKDDELKNLIQKTYLGYFEVR